MEFEGEKSDHETVASDQCPVVSKTMIREDTGLTGH
jgi:hypothetical protein